jgi:hemerythrin-like domain-containing protein
MDALTFLLNDHAKLRSLFQSGVYAPLRDELVKHVNVEEEVLYPALMKVPELEPIVLEAWEEHNLCMRLLQELDDMTEEDDKYREAKFTTLMKMTLEHLDEEEREMFPLIKKFSNEAFLNEVGEQMRTHKKKTDPDEVLYPEVPESHRPWNVPEEA